MSRSRKVEPKAAIGAAMKAFWKHGFSELGTRQLEEETGITRFTLQTTYGGKMKLFLVALDAYLETFENSAMMSQTEGGLESIASFFETRVDPASMTPESCYGCFMLNSMVEFASGNKDIDKRAQQYFTMLKNRFRLSLTDAQQSGCLGPNFNIEQKIEVLVSAALGLNVAIRAAGSNDAGKHMATSIACMVREWA